jgi:hypothetical protein
MGRSLDPIDSKIITGMEMDIKTDITEEEGGKAKSGKRNKGVM